MKEGNSDHFEIPEIPGTPEERKRTYEAAGPVLDMIMAQEIRSEIGEKFEGTEGNHAPQNLLTGLKGTVIDPLYENDWIKNGRPEAHTSAQELKSSLKAEMLHHYKTFFFPGYLRYDAKTGKDSLEEPRGLNHDIQKMLLEEAGFKLDKSKFHFFEAGKEDEIPKESLKGALIVSINDEERTAYEKERNEKRNEERGKMYAGPTVILHEVLNKAGFFEGLPDERKKELLGASLFADIIERGAWLRYTKEDFFDKTKINLFKINRLLNAEKLTGILGDMLAHTNVDWSDFRTARDAVQKAVIEQSSLPLTHEFVAAHHIEEVVAKQNDNMKSSYNYLKGGFNRKESFMGEVIYVHKDKFEWRDTLKGQLPAIAAKPPMENGKPAWEEAHGYFEASNASLLGYFKEKDANGFTHKIEKVAGEYHLNPQIQEIGGYVKVFIPFHGKQPTEFLSRFEKDGLQIKAPKEQKRNFRGPERIAEAR